MFLGIRNAHRLFRMKNVRMKVACAPTAKLQHYLRDACAPTSDLKHFLRDTNRAHQTRMRAYARPDAFSSKPGYVLNAGSTSFGRASERDKGYSDKDSQNRQAEQK